MISDPAGHRHRIAHDEPVQLLEHYQEEPLIRSLAGDAAMAEIVDEFVAELPSKIREIESALAAGNLKQLELIARCVKGEGTSYGCEPISESAAEIESMLRDGQSIEEIKPKVGELIRWCAKSRSSAYGLRTSSD